MLLGVMTVAYFIRAVNEKQEVAKNVLAITNQ